MTPELLEEVGRALYGRHWIGQLAADLDVADRSFRRWVSGQVDIPDGVRLDLIKLMDERRTQLVEVLERTV